MTESFAAHLINLEKFPVLCNFILLITHLNPSHRYTDLLIDENEIYNSVF